MLAEFLVKAKMNTYAKEGARSKRAADGSRELLYKEKNLAYKDKYFGADPFCGEEVVLKDGVGIWNMNYYGKTLSKPVPAEEIYKFLREALRKVDPSAPFRGPVRFEKKDFLYTAEVKGDISFFSGVEKIYHKKKLIYISYYHGGYVNK